MYDCVIVGAGASGLTAAIYLLRSNLKVAIVEESMPGGQVANTYVIENYPGFEKVDGVTLATNMYMQATNLGVEYFADKALKINQTPNGFAVVLPDNVLEAKTVIVATGMKHRKLGLAKEEALSGKGISWCAICDGNLYQGKDVAVVGGGNSALEESLYLANIVRHVYLIHRRDEFRADAMVVNKVKNTANIELLLNDEISELEGDDFLTGLVLKSGKQINVDGLFEYIGFLPNSELVQKYHITDEAGFIITDENCETKIKGLFATGDIIQKKVRQIVTAVNDGAIAALSILKYCR
jgi:thioredoxin reductase (NADPH)